MDALNYSTIRSLAQDHLNQRMDEAAAEWLARQMKDTASAAPRPRLLFALRHRRRPAAAVLAGLRPQGQR